MSLDQQPPTTASSGLTKRYIVAMHMHENWFKDDTTGKYHGTYIIPQTSSKWRKEVTQEEYEDALAAYNISHCQQDSTGKYTYCQAGGMSSQSPWRRRIVAMHMHEKWFRDDTTGKYYGTYINPNDGSDWRKEVTQNEYEDALAAHNISHCQQDSTGKYTN